MNIWERQARISRQLLRWAQANIIVGILLQLTRDKLLTGVGMQASGWGWINAGIAFFGNKATQKRRAALPEPNAAEIINQERGKLRRLLLLNAGLDVFYVLGGGWLAYSRGKNDRFVRGHGFGIIVQGLFLFFFDLIQAKKLDE